VTAAWFAPTGFPLAFDRLFSKPIFPPWYTPDGN